MSEILLAIVGFFKFFDEVSAFIKILQKTPVEKHQALVEAAQKESDSFAQSNRPTWD